MEIIVDQESTLSPRWGKVKIGTTYLGVHNGEKWGLFEGEDPAVPITSFKYDRISSLKEGEILELWSNDGSGDFFSCRKKEIVFSFEGSTSLSGNLLAVRQKHRWGVFDLKKGELIYPFEFTGIRSFSKEVFGLLIDEDKGFFCSTLDGKKLLNFDVLLFSPEDRLMVTKQGDRLIIFNLRTKKVLHRLDSILPFYGDLYEVSKNGRVGFFCSKDEEISIFWR